MLSLTSTIKVLPVGMQRSDLIRLLVSSLPKNTIQYNKRLLSVASLKDNSKVLLNFFDGEGATFDLVVGADGIRSKVKEYVLRNSSISPKYSGYAIWYGAARLPIEFSSPPTTTPTPGSSPNKDYDKLQLPELLADHGTLIKLMGKDGNFGCNRMGPSRTPGANDGLLGSSIESLSFY